jgi:hypothetical protein
MQARQLTANFTNDDRGGICSYESHALRSHQFAKEAAIAANALMVAAGYGSSALACHRRTVEVLWCVGTTADCRATHAEFAVIERADSRGGNEASAYPFSSNGSSRSISDRRLFARGRLL